MDEKVLFKSKPPQQNPTTQAQSPVAAQSQPVKTSVEPQKKSKKPVLKIILAIFAVIIIIFLVLLFIPKGAPKNVKLIWWGLWEEPQVVKPIIAEFEKENPNITVEYIKQDPKQYRERLTTRVNNNTGPDIFYFHNTWYPMIYNITSPLPSDVISADEFKKVFYSVIQKDLIKNGAIYGIPTGIDSISLFVNTDLLTAAGVKVPSNWDEFVKVSRSLTVKDEKGEIKTSGAALGSYDNITHSADIISMLLAQQGVNFSKFSSFASDESDVLDFYTSFAKGDNNTWDNDLDSSILLFGQGKLAMYFGFSWDVFAIQSLNKDLKFEVYPVPSLFDRKATIVSYWVNGVSAKSTHQNQAFLFMKFLSKKETAQKLFTESSKTRAFGTPYARIDLADSLKENKIINPFVSQLPNAASSFFASDTHDGDGGLNSSSNAYLSNAVNSMLLDESSPQTAVDTLDKGIAQILSKYAIK